MPSNHCFLTLNICNLNNWWWTFLVVPTITSMHLISSELKTCKSLLTSMNYLSFCKYFNSYKCRRIYIFQKTIYILYSFPVFFLCLVLSHLSLYLFIDNLIEKNSFDIFQARFILYLFFVNLTVMKKIIWWFPNLSDLTSQVKYNRS